MKDEKKIVTPQSEAIAGSGKENDQTPQQVRGDNAPKRHPDPTRYGDWELMGKCVDF